MNFERFLVYGWKVSIGKLELIRGLDGHGKYYKFKCKYYRTSIRDLK